MLCRRRGGNEVFASGLLCKELEAVGFSVQPGYFGIPTAFRAVFPGRAARPAVALLAEYDALPEIGHGCGHNIIGGSSSGCGLGLGFHNGRNRGCSLCVWNTGPRRLTGPKFRW